MKILVLSDSHGKIDNAQKVLQKINGKIEAVIHLGDVVSDVEALQGIYTNVKFYNVSGNCDYYNSIPSEQIINLGKKRILMTHGHKYHVKFGYDRILYAAEEKKVDICLFGHTHMPVTADFGNIVLMNPGSISLPRGINICTYGIIDISDIGVVTVSVVGMYNDGFRVINV